MNTTLTKWEVCADPRTLRRLHKTGEELSELQKVLHRITLQGMDGVNPSTGKTNRQELHEEMADVLAQCDCNVAAFDMDWIAIDKRRMAKVALMNQWEGMYP